eukprot:3142956-Pyramimonas_sp.AAC.1
MENACTYSMTTQLAPHSLHIESATTYNLGSTPALERSSLRSIADIARKVFDVVTVLLRTAI